MSGVYGITISSLIMIFFFKLIQSQYQYDHEMGLIPSSKLSTWVPIVVGINGSIIILTFCCLVSMCVNCLCKYGRRNNNINNHNNDELNEIVSMSLINIPSVV
uniref:Transmembrane protein n=1 Tax=Strongyloides papillosus TaxID=174720 RepID=A0A0N5C4T3_STREA